MAKQLILEINPILCPDKSPVEPGIMLTPPLDKDYWHYKVKLHREQAIVGFPKFGTIGIGFAVERDWNTNLPYTCETQKIYDHIAHNKRYKAISETDCLLAINMIQEFIRHSRGK